MQSLINSAQAVAAKQGAKEEDQTMGIQLGYVPLSHTPRSTEEHNALLETLDAQHRHVLRCVRFHPIAVPTGPGFSSLPVRLQYRRCNRPD